MTVKIKTETAIIPVEVGGLKFGFDTSDASIKKFEKNALKVQKELKQINVDQDDKINFETLKEVLKQGYDLVLGEGAFEKIYELSPSVMLMFQYFEQIVNGIETKLKEMNLTDSGKRKVR